MHDCRYFFHFKKLGGMYSAVTGYDFIFLGGIVHRSDNDSVEQSVFFDTLYKFSHGAIVKYLVRVILKRVKLLNFNVH